MSEQESLERMLQYETEAQLQCFQSREARERVRAFLERRAPRLNEK
jgi:enoyl-CoA hydratase/carnithine racemase